MVHRLRQFHMYREFSEMRTDRIPLDHLIDGAYTRTATDPKDMAYGLWAILQRLTWVPLPEVDYEESKETIYFVFSRLLVLTTGSAHLLLLAALNNMEGQASWAPDWAPERARDCDWGDIEELIRGNGNADDLKTNFKDSASISMVDPVTVSIWGRRHCTVVATFVFLKTESSYQQTDYHKHIYNLAHMMKIRSSGFTLAWSRVGERWFSAINSGRLAQWTRFLKKHHNLEASALLLLLRSTVSDENHQDSATVDPEILRTHITVCNILAQLDRILYQQTYSGIHTFSSMGWCRRGVKEGDLIIKCPGVQIPLIVRSCSDMNNRVQIKSIAHTPSVLFFHGVPRPEVNGTSELEEFHVY